MLLTLRIYTILFPSLLREITTYPVRAYRNSPHVMDAIMAPGNGFPADAIKCIDMHTTGEPTRIIYSGFPRLTGTLLDQREQAVRQHDVIRRRIMLEPRGHDNMYGAIIVPDTELVRSGEAHIGVLFTHNGGFSTMCGHATIALGRFLVDTHDLHVFPKRNELTCDGYDPSSPEVVLNLHAPCGLVRVTVPTTPDGQMSDSSRPVSFLSAPAYAAATDLKIRVPAEVAWPEIGHRESITLHISYGGAFYALVDVKELGFDKLTKFDLTAMTHAVGKLKPYLETHPDVVGALQSSVDERLSFLYSVMVVDSIAGWKPEGVDGAETGLCFFADNQIDRSPTGSCVTARMALANAIGIRGPGQRWAYNSLLSNHFNTGAFIASITSENTRVKTMNGSIKGAVTVRVEGNAYYTGSATFVLETGDLIGEKGFTMKEIAG